MTAPVFYAENYMKITLLIFLLVLMTNVFFVFADDGHSLRGKHMDNGLKCVDCHGTDKPDSPAKTSACKSCHENGPDVKIETTLNDQKYVLPVHNAHTGSLRCTLCHRVHEASTLYCNKCHQFSIIVP